jgi:hypothetical protein
MKKTKFLALLIAGTMLAGSMAACSEDDPDGEDLPSIPALSITNVSPTSNLKYGDVVTITGVSLDSAFMITFALPTATITEGHWDVMRSDFEAGATSTEIKVKVPVGTAFPCFVAAIVSTTMRQVPFLTPLTADANTIMVSGNSVPDSVGTQPGWMVTITGLNLDKVTEVLVNGEAIDLVTATEGEITQGWLDNVAVAKVGTPTSLWLKVPNADWGSTVTVTINPGALTTTFKIQEAVPNYPIDVFESTDHDNGLVFMDLDENRGVWWGMETPAQYTIDSTDAVDANSGKYLHINCSYDDNAWLGVWRNDGLDSASNPDGGANWNFPGKTAAAARAALMALDISKTSLKMDVKVLQTEPTCPFKFRLGDYWIVIQPLFPSNSWYTISFPLNTFMDNDGNGTNAFPGFGSAGSYTYSDATSDFGPSLGTWNGAGSVNILIDNIRFVQAN